MLLRIQEGGPVDIVRIVPNYSRYYVRRNVLIKTHLYVPITYRKINIRTYVHVLVEEPSK